jgi:hypothetical protein
MTGELERPPLKIDAHDSELSEIKNVIDGWALINFGPPTAHPFQSDGELTLVRFGF